jgi:16S rRNA processing protein RimM
MAVIVGVILRPHGLSGDLKIKPLTDNPHRFLPGKKLLVQSPGGETRELVLERVRSLQDHLLVSFEGYESRAQVEPWAGGTLRVREEDVPDLPEGEYYHYQILGMKVMDRESGEYLGEVVDILSTEGNDVYVVRGGDREHLIPAIREVVREVDVRGNRMMISRMEGLDEL